MYGYKNFIILLSGKGSGLPPRAFFFCKGLFLTNFTQKAPDFTQIEIFKTFLYIIRLSVDTGGKGANDMKLIKTTKKHYIYELSEKEMNSPEVDNGFKYLAYLKENYEDYKPSFKYDIGYQDYEDVEQHQDFKYGGVRINNDGYNQGGSNVYAVIEKWIKEVLKYDI